MVSDMTTAINMQYHGSLTALASPMQRDGQLDDQALESLIDYQIDGGTIGVIPVGTTGESPTLTHREHARFIEKTIEYVNHRMKVMAGAGSNSTEEAVGMARHAHKAGADALLVVVPYYNKPTQEGLYRHFMTVADATPLPLWLYCIPGRSVVDLAPETVERLARHPNIVGTKDATANMARPLAIRSLAGKDFNQLSGDDGTILSFRAAGGHGCISVTSNVAPRHCAELHQLWEARRLEEAIALQDRLTPLHDALFVETSPGPVKYALSRLGIGSPTLRLPLVEPEERTRKQVDAALRGLGLLGN